MTDFAEFLTGRFAATHTLTGRISPLSRFLPPVPDGIAEAWLRQRLPGNPTVLDPFGTLPRLPVELAHAGCKVVVASNNPVARFLLELAARPPKESEMRAALAELAATYKGDERIEPHIRQLYRTECAQCRRAIEAEAFIWDRGAAAPSARLYHCLYCGDHGERPVNEQDIERAARYNTPSLHHSRALERVAALDDPDRVFVKAALEVYLPRAVYTLFTLINKLDSVSAVHRPLVEALILAACDQANTLWQYPTTRARPRQLTVPIRFRENNIWMALEEAVVSLSAPESEAQPAIQVTLWPHLPAEGGITIYDGRLRDLSEKEASLQFDAAIGALPRPNQAYWALSALWAGWIWGRAAAAPFKSVLRRKRFDWGWHTAALFSAFSGLSSLMQNDAPVFGLIGEAEPGFITSALISARMAGFDLEGLALREGDNQAQITWRRRNPPAENLPQKPMQIAAQQGAQQILRSRDEPAAYLPLHTASLQEIVRSPDWKPVTDPEPGEMFSQVGVTLQNAISYRGGFVRFGGSEHSMEVGQWWLKTPPNDAEKRPHPLADRIEMALVKFLQQQDSCTFEEVDAALCGAFRGLETPDQNYVRLCLASYGEQVPQGSDTWMLRSQDLPRQRRADLAAVIELVEEIGNRLGYQCEKTDSFTLRWKAESGNYPYSFQVIASAVMGKILRQNISNTQPVLVYPGSRAGLLAFKLKTNSLLSGVAENWRFLKYRHLRRLAESSLLERENLESQLKLDPPDHRDLQIPLL